jgi:hypothetical protein
MVALKLNLKKGTSSFFDCKKRNEEVSSCVSYKMCEKGLLIFAGDLSISKKALLRFLTVRRGMKKCPRVCRTKCAKKDF